MTLAQAGRLLAISAFACAFAVPAALADDAVPTVRIRGTIEQVDGSVLKVKTRDASQLTVKLAKDPVVIAIVKASLSDIKPGNYVGIAGMPQPDGTQQALEVHIFPESMRGTGEGHRPWDLNPQSTMTNGNVEQAVTAVGGQSLKVKYKDGEKSVSVPANTPIVTYVPGALADLKPGLKIFIAAASKQPDGTLETKRVNYGRDGLTPPM